MSLTPEERADSLRKRLLFPEEKPAFVEIVAAEIRAAIAEERDACEAIAMHQAALSETPEYDGQQPIVVAGRDGERRASLQIAAAIRGRTP